MTTITQVITALPTAPDPATMTPVVFSTTAAASVLAQKAMTPELNTWAGQANTVAAEVSANAATATTQAANAAASAAAAAVNAPVWSAGTNYALGTVVYSPTSFYTYRNIVAGVHATDPASDTTNWKAVAALPGGSSSQAFSTSTLTASGNVTFNNNAADAHLNVVSVGTIQSSVLQLVGRQTSVDNEWNIVGVGSALGAANLRIVKGGWTTAPIVEYSSTGETVTGAISATTTITAPQLVSNVATGTAPFTVTSTTPVANLVAGGNALLAGSSSQAFSTAALSVNGLLSASALMSYLSSPSMQIGASFQNDTLGAGYAGVRFGVDTTYFKSAIVHQRTGANGTGNLLILNRGTGDAANVTQSDVVASFSPTGLAVTGAISATTTIKTGGYTVGTLPTPSIGMRTYVTDALTPVFGATVVGGGAVVIPVFYNGTNWIVG